MTGQALLEGVASEGILLTLQGTEHRALTNTEGRFTMEDVPVGTHTLVAQQLGYRDATQSVQVQAGETATVTLHLTAELGALQGLVIREDEAPVPDARVTLVETGTTRTTDELGHVNLGSLVPGTYTVVAEKAGHVRAQQTVRVTNVEFSLVTLILRRERGSLNGTALLEGATAHDGITLTLLESGATTTTDAQGHFTFASVPTGTYTVQARKGLYADARQPVEIRANLPSQVSLTLNRLQAPELTAPALAVQRGHLRLTGAHFGAEQGSHGITLGGVEVDEYLAWSDAEVVVRVPESLAPGVHELVMTSGVSWRPDATASLRVLRQRTLSYAANWGMGVLPDNTVTIWGSADASTGLTPVPSALSDVVSVASGMSFAVALQADGSVIKWGGPDPLPVPDGLSDVVAISASGARALALKRDGSVVTIATSNAEETPVPEGLRNVVAVSAGPFHGMALKADGTLSVWGQDVFDLQDVPADLQDVVVIASTSNSALALRSDGTAAVWGFGAAYYDLASTPDLSDVVEVAGGEHHYMALRSNGSLLAWGNSAYGQTTLPSGLTDVAAVAGQAFNKSLALRWNGTLANWGTRRLCTCHLRASSFASLLGSTSTHEEGDAPGAAAPASAFVRLGQPGLTVRCVSPRIGLVAFSMGGGLNELAEVVRPRWVDVCDDAGGLWLARAGCAGVPGEPLSERTEFRGAWPLHLDGRAAGGGMHRCRDTR
ncbi:lipoprotein, putative [Myxococcus hansupus]|uniref:Lipoprotein, putative n=1 Tax=Pseudomyxococcus hansupus TaxID=1297742 RepID=A0A0H4WX57_9BACT|nr:lipoprotein, putative [Myxococcus hansupus]